MDKIKFAQMINRLTIWGLRKLEYDEMSELEQLTKTEPRNVKANHNDMIDFMNAMKDGLKIDAIKAHRSMCEADLRTSKNFVEAYWFAQPKVDNG